MLRKIIQIDQDKCNGCGLCASACHEGAIDIIDGKAKLVRENFCDGFGDCLSGCPTGAITFIEREAPAYDESAVKKARQAKIAPAPVEYAPSQLAQWPCQIKLVPPLAPFFHDAHLLIAADCTAYAYAAMHERFMRGRVTIIGCPKLDDVDYTPKLTQIIGGNSIASVTIVRMEVPCCGGLQRAVQNAVELSGKDIPCRVVVISRDGHINTDTAP